MNACSTYDYSFSFRGRVHVVAIAMQDHACIIMLTWDANTRMGRNVVPYAIGYMGRT